MLGPAHYVTNSTALRFCNDERFGEAVEGIYEKVGGVVLREANPIDVDYRLKIRRRETPKAIVSLN